MKVLSSQPVLVERDGELALLRAAAADASARRGGVVVIEAPAGQGKTALLRAFREEATAAGLRVLPAVGAELGRDFPFGVVQQLFEGAARAAGEAGRARLFAGAADLARPALEPGAAAHDAADASFARLHGLYWLAANLADEHPLVLLVDDAHWADAPSLRFLDVLARRLEDLPILVAIGTRPAEPGAEQDLLDSLASGPNAQVLRPRALSVAGVGELLDRALGTPAEDAFVAAAAATTAGSPLLLRELLRTVAEEGLQGRAGEVALLRRALPSNVGRIVIARLRRLAPDVLAVAQAVAVLGDGATLGDVAELAGLPVPETVSAHAALSRAGLLEAAELRFSHPIVREAVHADLVSGERADRHRAAAALRHRAGADPVEVAAHLLSAEPGAGAWARRALVVAGRRALSDGAPDVAARYLRRALAEHATDDDHQSVLLSLGHAEARTGDPRAVARLEAAAAGPDARLALEAERLRAQVHVLHARTSAGIEVLRDALDRAARHCPDLAVELENDLIDVLAHHVPLRAEYLQRLEAAADEDRPTLLAHLAFVRAITGAPAEEVLDLARRALAAPDAGGEGRFIHFYAVEALMMVEAADETAAALRDATAMAQRLGSRVVAGPLTYMPSSWIAWERAFGDLRRAEELAREALDVMLAARMPAMVVTMRSSLGVILLDRGRVDEADALMAELPARETGPGLKETHAMRARLRHVQGRHEEALRELEIEFELERERGWVTGNRDPSRLTHVRVLLALGRHDEAQAAAAAELEVAERRGVAGAQARARLALALTLDGSEARDELHTAVAVASRSPARRLRAEVLGQLGAALRRHGDRLAARAALTEARELAHRCGATGLEERLHDELMVAGARPRRIALSGVESLTAAERRVADLAAQGRRNREIAETLFVTLKTVEVHLGRVYGKLGIKGRSQLAGALASETSP
jgi:DNA-binding CsgD family transcriptional regulator